MKVMPDDLTQRGPADRARVDVYDAQEIRYWNDKFGCTSEELKAAVKTVGPNAFAVQVYLGKSPDVDALER